MNWGKTMDVLTFTQKVKEALVESQLDEARHLIEIHAEHFPRETEELLCEGICNRQVHFQWVKTVNSIVQFRPALIQTAVKGKQWTIVMNALDSEWACVVLSHLSHSKDDTSSFVEELCCVRLRDEMRKFCLLVVEAGLLDLLKEIVSCVGKFDGQYCGDIHPTHRALYSLIYKSLVKDCAKDKMVEVCEAISEDERYPCQYLSTLLAARLNKWKRVTSAVRTGRVVLLKGSDDVFFRAMNRRAWGCAAQILQSVMLVKDVVETDILLDIQFKAEVCLMRRRGFSALVLMPFLQLCVREKLYAAGALVAAWARRWGIVKVLLGHLQQGTADNANTIVLEEVMKNRKFRLVYDWLQCPTQQNLWPAYVDCVLWEATVNCKNHEAHALVEQLMDKCEDASLLGQVFYHIILYCQSDLLQKFLAKDLLQRSDDLEFALHCAVDMFGSTWTRSNHCQSNPRYQMLLRCLEAGCSNLLCGSTNLPTPMDVAVKLGLMPVIRLFYHTGATSSAVLHSIHRRLESDSESEPKGNAAEVKSFFQHVTDTPRSLSSMCCISLSRLIGCSADRKHRALQLGLPVSLTRKVLFIDDLYRQN